MQTFKKVLLSISLFLILFTGISEIVIGPYYNSEVTYYQDGKARQELSGTIDYVTIGASHALAGFVPEILDEKLGCNSYNLSVSMMPMYAKYVLLEKEFSRNKIDTVVLEISYDTLQRKSGEEYAIGDEPMIARLDSWQERFSYLIKYVALDDWLNIYSRSFVEGLWNWKNILTGQRETVDFSGKGYREKESVDITLSEENAEKTYNTATYVENFNQENYDMFLDIIDLCHANGARIIIAVVPVSDGLIWEYDNLDDFVEWGTNFSKENNCEFYDFNLIANRYSIFNDAFSFADADHMSEAGARTFTEIYCDIMNQIASEEDISADFYQSYEALKKDSPYYQYIN